MQISINQLTKAGFMNSVAVLIVTMIGVAPAARCDVQVYQFTGGISGTAPGQISDIGNTTGHNLGNVPQIFLPIDLGTLNETVYLDPVNLTVRQVGSFLSPGNSTGVLNETHVVGGQNVSATLTLSQGLAGGALSFDTSPLPIVWNASNQTYTYFNSGFWPELYNFPVSGTYSLDTGGEIYTGTFAYNLGPTGFPPPVLYTTFSPSPNQLSLTLGGLTGYHNWVQGPPGFVDVTANNGFQIHLNAGEYDDRLQDFDWSGGPITAQLQPAPEPGCLTLVSIGLWGLACHRRLIARA
jgi:hypothetical protein